MWYNSHILFQGLFMAKVTAYLCEDTGALFLKEEEYKKHRRAFLTEQKRQAARKAQKDELTDYFRQIRSQITSVEALTKFINKNYYTLLEKALMLNKGVDFSYDNAEKLLKAYKKDPENTDFKCSISFKRPDYTKNNQSVYSLNQSNSHKCPEGGVTNWGGRVEGAPRGYPGARWDFRVKHSNDPTKINPTLGIRMVLNALRLHPGTGGSDYGDMEVFSQDWPFQAREQLTYALAKRNAVLLSEIMPLCQTMFPDLNIKGLKEVIELQDLNFQDAHDFVFTALKNYKSKNLDNAIDILSTVKTGSDTFKSTVDAMLTRKSIVSQELPDLDVEI